MAVPEIVHGNGQSVRITVVFTQDFDGPGTALLPKTSFPTQTVTTRNLQLARAAARVRILLSTVSSVA